MDRGDRQLIERLRVDHPELGRLVAEHQTLERKLHEIDGQRWISDAENLELRRLKKLKLKRRDRIEAILARHR